MDKFNDIWKDRFNQGDIPDADWNTPDSEVWDAILPHVPQKRDNRPLLFWIILGLSLLGIGVLSYFLINHDHSVSQGTTYESEQPVLAYAEQNVAGTTTPADQSGKQAFIINNQKDKATIPVKNQRTNPEIRDSEFAGEDQRIKNNSNFVTHTSINSALQTRTESRGIDQRELDDEQPVMDAPKAKQILNEHARAARLEDALLSPLHFLPTLDAEVEWNQEITPENLGGLDHLDIVKPKRLKLALQTGAIYWQHQISEQYTSDLSAFDFNYSDSWGWSTSLGAAYTINDKFAIGIGLSYEQIQTKSGHNSNLSYDPNQEQGMEAANDYDATLATPYGTAGASFRFKREEELGEEPIDLLVDFHSAHTIQNVSAPISMFYYPMGQKRNWVPVASVGLGTNYLFGLSNQIESINTNHDAISYEKSGDAAFADPSLERLYFDVRVGAGVEYRLPANFSLGIQGTWARGLNPIFEQDDYQTRINRYQIQAQISKRF